MFCRADGAPIDPRTFNRAFTRALAQAGLPAIRVHDARHTFATWLLEQGVSPKVVQTMLGHSNITITLNTYTHVSLDMEKQAAAALNTALTRGLQQCCSKTGHCRMRYAHNLLRYKNIYGRLWLLSH